MVLKMNDFFQWIGSLIVSGGVAQLSVWALKGSVEARLNLSVQQQVENLKNENQRELEHLKSELTRQGQAEIERVKASLQGELQKAQHTTTRLHDVYPELVEKMGVAEGAVGQLLGIGWATDLSRYNDEELAALLKELNIAGRDREETLRKVEAESGRGIRHIEKLQRTAEVQRARHRVDDLKRTLRLKSLYISDTVREACWQIATKLGNAWVNVHVASVEPSEGGFGKHQKLMDEVAADIEAVERQMRAELAAQLGQTTPSLAKGSG